VTLALLWKDYRGQHPDDGYGYSRFCDLYGEWRRGVTATKLVGSKRLTHLVSRQPPVCDSSRALTVAADIAC
jgi:hypothetical protein